MYKNNQFQLLKKVVATLIIFAIAWLIYFIVTHGYIENTSANTSDPTTYVRMTDDLSATPIETTNAQVFLQSGKYAVAYHGKFGASVITNPTVPYALFTQNLATNSTPPQVETLGRNSLINIIKKDNNYYSFNDQGVFRLIDKNNITNDNQIESKDGTFPSFNQYIRLSNELLAGVITTNEGLQPLIYNLISKTVTYQPLIDSDKVKLKPTSDGYAIYNITDDVLYQYRINSRGVDTFTLSGVGRVTHADGVPVFDKSKSFLGVVTGDDFLTGGDGDAQNKNEYKVSVLDIKLKKIIKSFNFSSNPVTDISIAPDEKTIAIQTSSSLGVYRIKDKKQLFVSPVSATDFHWLNASEFLFLSTNRGIFHGSTRTLVAQSLIGYNTIRPSRVSYIDGDKVYFSGYSSAIGGGAEASAYRANLSRDTTSEALQVHRKFPHQGNGFYVDVLGKNITIQTTRYTINNGVSYNDNAKKAGLKYVTQQLGDSLSDYTVRYSYVDLAF